MYVVIAPLVLGLLVKCTQASCPEGFICKAEGDRYELICNPRIDKVKFQRVECNLTDAPLHTTRLKIRCFSNRVLIALSFANLSHVLELTLERLNFHTREPNVFNGVNNITHLVLQHVSSKRLDERYFEGLADLRSLTIEYLDELEYMHPDVLKPLVSLQSLSFRYIGKANAALQYANYSRILGGIQNSNFHTLILYAIHTARYSETHLNIDDLFRYGTVGASLKYLDLGKNNVEFFSGLPIITLPLLEYISLADNVLLGSQFVTIFWIQLIGHMRLKTLDISGMNKLASATSSEVIFSLTVNNNCNRAIKMALGPRLESISLSNTTLLAHSFKYGTAPFCFVDSHRVLKYIDISNARCTTPITCSVAQLHTLEHFNLQNVNIVNISNDLFSNMPNLTVLLMGRNSIADVVAKDTENRLFGNNDKLQVLDLAECQLTEIPSGEFSNLCKLQHLNLSGNSLHQFKVNVQNLAVIEIINLSRNKLTTLGSEVRSHLDKIASMGQVQVDLSDNPLQCTCTNTDFVTWTHLSKVTFLKKDNTFCFDGNHSKHMIFQFDSTTLETKCHPDPWMIAGPWIVLPVVVILLAVCIMTYATYRYRWKCAYMWSRATLRRTASDVEMDQAVYERDVFVCYNSNDSGWVCHDLLDKLDKHRISTVIHHRDFLPGSVLEETINESIAKCHYTMLVLSPDFLASNWCLLEMHLARNRIISEGRDVIVPVILRQFPVSLLTRTLEGILSKSYLQWTDDPDGQELFWDKLTTKLKHGGNLRPLKM